MRKLASSAARVAMVKPANFGDGDDTAALRRLDLAEDGRVAAQGQMGAASVVVGEVLRKDAHQVALVERDHVVQALAPDVGDQPLDVGILPRRARRGEDFLDAEVGGGSVEGLAVTAVAVVEQEARRRAEGKGLPDLPGHPHCGRVPRHVEVEDPASVVGHKDKAINHLEGGGGHGGPPTMTTKTPHLDPSMCRCTAS
jgi:hypothetical protein